MPHRQEQPTSSAENGQDDLQANMKGLWNPVPDEELGTHESQPHIATHPLGLKPRGNQLLSNCTSGRVSLGTFYSLPDEVLMQFLEYLDCQTLRVLGYTCKFLYASCSVDELWKSLFLESGLGNGKTSFTWLGNWRSTVLGLTAEKQIHIDCWCVFSDVLHRPFVCSQLQVNQYAGDIPKCNMIRRFDDLSYEAFEEKWSNTPFILTQTIREWPVLKDWSIEALRKTYADVAFRAESVDWPFSTYYEYMRNTQDESPLYLFDRKFVEKMSITVGREEGGAYWKPDCFGPDLFEVLGDSRPAHRWLIIGPSRSGSTFHKDPNGTSAWNAVIQGAKYWIMFPPSVAVPGVYVSQDNSEVTSPLSIAEWLLEFHAEARELPECIEGVCKAGEILHVPSGWWHLVVNLEAGIALTQNFVPTAHLPEVLSFLRDRAEQVTGFKRDVENPYELFVQGLQEKHPALLEEAIEKLEKKDSRKKRTWDAAIGTDKEDGGQDSAGFTFGFGFGGDDEEIP